MDTPVKTYSAILAGEYCADGISARSGIPRPESDSWIRFLVDAGAVVEGSGGFEASPEFRTPVRWVDCRNFWVGVAEAPDNSGAILLWPGARLRPFTYNAARLNCTADGVHMYAEDARYPSVPSDMLSAIAASGDSGRRQARRLARQHVHSTMQDRLASFRSPERSVSAMVEHINVLIEKQDFGRPGSRRLKRIRSSLVSAVPPYSVRYETPRGVRVVSCRLVLEDGTVAVGLPEHSRG